MANEKTLKRLNYAPGLDNAIQRNFELTSDNFVEIFSRLDRVRYAQGELGSTATIDNTGFGTTAPAGSTAGLEVSLDVVLDKPVIITLVNVIVNSFSAVITNPLIYVQNSTNGQAFFEYRISISSKVLALERIVGGDANATSTNYKMGVPYSAIRAIHFPDQAGITRYLFEARTTSATATGVVGGGALRMVAIQLL